jgi:lipopolysaccharide/colanic/teichoic acid biosynthesis glycosyltransferase
MLNQANLSYLQVVSIANEVPVGGRTKRIFDGVFAVIASVALLPLFAASALW